MKPSGCVQVGDEIKNHEKLASTVEKTLWNRRIGTECQWFIQWCLKTSVAKVLICSFLQSLNLWSKPPHISNKNMFSVKSFREISHQEEDLIVCSDLWFLFDSLSGPVHTSIRSLGNRAWSRLEQTYILLGPFDEIWTQHATIYRRYLMFLVVAIWIYHVMKWYCFDLQKKLYFFYDVVKMMPSTKVGC